jgi:cell division septum initiation protein DivIVA
MEPPVCRICGTKHWGSDHQWSGKAPALDKPARGFPATAPDAREALLAKLKAKNGELQAEVEQLKAENANLRERLAQASIANAESPKHVPQPRKPRPPTSTKPKAPKPPTDTSGKRGRKPKGEAPISAAERAAAYRARKANNP